MEKKQSSICLLAIILKNFAFLIENYISCSLDLLEILNWNWAILELKFKITYLLPKLLYREGHDHLLKESYSNGSTDFNSQKSSKPNIVVCKSLILRCCDLRSTDMLLEMSCGDTAITQTRQKLYQTLHTAYPIK